MANSSTTTIHLLPQEELSSLLRRLKDTSADRITLVLPDKSLVAQGLIGLQVLADEAKKLHKDLVVSSDSAQIQRLSRRVGLEVAGSGEGLPEHGFMAGADMALLGATAIGASEASGSTEQGVRSTEAMDESAPPIVPAQDKVVEKPVIAAAVSTPKPVVKTQQTGLMGRLKAHGWKWGVGLAVILLLLFGGTAYALNYYLPHATVTVFAQKQSLDRDVNILADPNATEANVKTLTVPAKTVTTKASKTQTFAATGKKDVGTKASGTVTIFNKTNADKTLAAGTVVASSGQQFLLSKAVTVEAATIATSIDPVTLKVVTTTTPGSADATIAAADIGEAYNLAAKATFSVAKFDSSSFSGRNDAALTGGTKKSVKVVTASDQSDALDEMSSSLEDSATTDLKAKVSQGDQLLTESVVTEVTNKDFSQAVGDQSDDFSLTLEVTASGAAVNPDDIQTMLNTEVSTKVPDGYTLDTDHSSVDNHVLGTDDDGVVRLTSTYKAQVIPIVDTDAMKKAIAGKKASVVQDYLKSQPNLTGYDIAMSINLPAPFNHLPSVASHIVIKVEVK